MTRFLAVLLSLGAVGSAQAQRASTIAMDCAQARATVSRQGAIVLGTGGATYDRFVRDRSFCEITEITIPAFVPTRDDANCFVGYRCKEPGRGDRFDDGF
ncbi:hypothetical protein [Methylobacterium gossipiicola]|uniref:Uncharacterized protein n=1 Tax=Methylobacterium gossipiicola TaxID=582675 RepID=A0A1I2WB46_9HYPH|nr:hypothetical protein [Methylobacterium gossipiicola]SFG96711.1 hypothetical protein SAMN05192565_12016 [Methylobacterium gossipiicola]